MVHFAKPSGDKQNMLRFISTNQSELFSLVTRKPSSRFNTLLFLEDLEKFKKSGVWAGKKESSEVEYQLLDCTNLLILYTQRIRNDELRENISSLIIKISSSDFMKLTL